MGDNIFLSKFASEDEKKKVFIRGPWHLDRALLLLFEPISIGDIKKQSFTHTSFWVQIHNISIMCMDRMPFKSWDRRLVMWRKLKQMKQVNV